LLKDRGDRKAADTVRELALDVKQTPKVRAQAVVTWTALATPKLETLLDWATGTDTAIATEAMRSLTKTKLTAQQLEQLEKVFPNNTNRTALVKRIANQPLYTDRPPTKNIDAWLKRLDGSADAESGRRIFEHSLVTSCSKCLRLDGRGADVGPDLSLIGRTDRRWILESILQPSTSVAPHFQAWRIETKNGKTQTGLLVHTNLDESTYVDPLGNRFKVLANDVEELVALRESIMPEDLVNSLTDQELRDLLAYLQSRK
jgi:putative heme-binding domain-containing protein